MLSLGLLLRKLTLILVVVASSLSFSSGAIAGEWETISATWYGGPDDGLVGHGVACGGELDEVHLTVATRGDPCMMSMEICLGDRCVRAVRNDYGPASWTGRDIDLGPAAARAIGLDQVGVADVRVRRLGIVDEIPVVDGPPLAPPPQPVQKTDGKLPRRFMTPSGNIRCALLGFVGNRPTSLRCRVRSSGFVAQVRRRTKKWVVRGAGASRELDQLPYGTTWQRGSFQCESETSGLKCKNRKTQHGFFLSRESSRTF